LTCEPPERLGKAVKTPLVLACFYRECSSSNVSTPDSGFGDEDRVELSLSKPESEFEKASINNFSSPVNAPADDIWKMIQERNPENKAAKIEVIYRAFFICLKIFYRMALETRSNSRTWKSKINDSGLFTSS
jgi:hypothetical protein